MNREQLFAWVAEQYGVEPEYLWRKHPSYAILRRKNNEKWFALVADVDKAKLGLEGTGRIDIVNVKEDPGLIAELLRHDGFFPAYHMNKENWISIALDGPVDEESIKSMITTSYELARGK